MRYIQQACYIFVFGYCLFGPKPMAMPLAGAVALSLAGAGYVLLDMHFEWRDISPLRIAVIVSVYLVILALFLGVAAEHNPRFVREVTDHYAHYGFATAAFCLGGAVLEEVVFRRHLVRQLQRFMSLNAAMAASSGMFMLFHGSLLPTYFLDALSYCLLTYKLRSFHAAIALHAIFNFIGLPALTMQASPAEMDSRALLHASTAMTSMSFTLLLFGGLAVRAVSMHLRGAGTSQRDV